MEVRSITKYQRISPLKARQVALEVQGLPALQALSLMQFSPKKAARILYKTIKSAVANAENNHNIDARKLVIKESVVGAGTTIKRFRPRARGSASPIRKRTSHFKIVLTDGEKTAPVTE
ncbi:MAG: 50S ribosomal protein L22 [Verrucomicrobiota bacterium]|nr:50S ribosomal protein L22 [Verrucomicrobiota bacterium]